jgi:ABC-type maltose transport system permease subunit
MSSPANRETTSAELTEEQKTQTNIAVVACRIRQPPPTLRIRNDLLLAAIFAVIVVIVIVVPVAAAFARVGFATSMVIAGTTLGAR